MNHKPRPMRRGFLFTLVLSPTVDAHAKTVIISEYHIFTKQGGTVVERYIPMLSFVDREIHTADFLGLLATGGEHDIQIITHWEDDSPIISGDKLKIVIHSINVDSDEEELTIHFSTVGDTPPGIRSGTFTLIFDDLSCAHISSQMHDPNPKDADE